MARVFASIVTIQRSGMRAAAIVQDLLTLARRAVPTSEVVNLNEIISEYLKSPERERLMSFHPAVRVETQFDKDLLNILGSPLHLSKTLMNLISNAAEAMEAGHKERVLNISTRHLHEKECVSISFADSGVGIPRENLSKLFEPFFSTKKKGKGVGLGLSVAYGIIQEHGGSIQVQSEEGKGTVFAIELPLKVNPQVFQS